MTTDVAYGTKELARLLDSVDEAAANDLWLRLTVRFTEGRWAGRTHTVTHPAVLIQKERLKAPSLLEVIEAEWTTAQEARRWREERTDEIARSARYADALERRDREWHFG